MPAAISPINMLQTNMTRCHGNAHAREEAHLIVDLGASQLSYWHSAILAFRDSETRKQQTTFGEGDRRISRGALRLWEVREKVIDFDWAPRLSTIYPMNLGGYVRLNSMAPFDSCQSWDWHLHPSLNKSLCIYLISPEIQDGRRRQGHTLHSHLPGLELIKVAL